jgi:hypothetical protein
LSKVERDRWLTRADPRANRFGQLDPRQQRIPLAALSQLPRINHPNPHRFEIRNIPRDHRQPMNHRRRRDQGIAVRARVGHMKTRATLRHGRVDRQDAAFEARQDLFVDPGAQHGALRRVPARASKRAELDFQDRYRRQEKLAAGTALAQATTWRSALSGRLSSEMTLVSRRNISRDRPA